MNLTQPPFDDVHVRRAMNWIIDKAALRQAWGGPLLGGDRRTTSSPTRSSATSSPLRPVQDARRPRQPREGEAGDARLEVRHRSTTARAARPPATTFSCSTSTRRRRTSRCSRSSRPTRRRSGSRSTSSRSPAPPASSGRRRRTSRSRSSRLGEGLSRPGHVLLAALRRPHDHPARATRTSRSSGSTPSRAKKLGLTGNTTSVPNVDARPRPLRRARRTGAAHLLRAARPDADDEGRPVGAVPAGERRAHHRPAGHAVAVRPVHRRDGVRARRRFLSASRQDRVSDRARGTSERRLCANRTTL